MTDIHPENNTTTAANDSASGTRLLRRTGAFWTRADVTWRQAIEGSVATSALILLGAAGALAIIARRRRT